ncbi:MAG: hypothetical protein D6741_15085 [Planctomycetota bacterium]|nr:MAG: hypothetical protein D6741_15085 [Planctomycetota bacterium]
MHEACPKRRLRRVCERETGIADVWFDVEISKPGRLSHLVGATVFRKYLRKRFEYSLENLLTFGR